MKEHDDVIIVKLDGDIMCNEMEYVDGLCEFGRAKSEE